MVNDIIPHFWDGKLYTRHELRGVARDLLGSNFDDAVKIYHEYLQEEPSVQELVEAAESKLDDYVTNSQLAHDSSIRCYRWAIRSLTQEDLEIAERIKRGLDYLAEEGRRVKNKSSFYERDVDGCETWLFRKVNGKPGPKDVILDKYEHEQITEKEDWRDAVEALIIVGKLDDSISVYRTHLKGETIPTDLLINAAERLLETGDWSVGQKSLEYFNVAMNGSIDGEVIERIRNGIKNVRDLLTEADIKTNGNWMEVDSCEKELNKRLDPNYYSEDGKAKRNIEFRQLARRSLEMGCVSDAIGTYEEYLGGDIQVLDLVEFSEMGHTEEMRRKCWGQAINTLDFLHVETVQSINEQLVSSGFDKMYRKFYKILQERMTAIKSAGL